MDRQYSLTRAINSCQSFQDSKTVIICFRLGQPRHLQLVKPYTEGASVSTKSVTTFQ